MSSICRLAGRDSYFLLGFTKVLVALGQVKPPGDYRVAEIIDLENPSVKCHNLPWLNSSPDGSPLRTIGGLNADLNPFLCIETGDCYTLENFDWNKNNMPLNIGRKQTAFCKSPYPDKLIITTGGTDSGNKLFFIN